MAALEAVEDKINELNVEDEEEDDGASPADGAAAKKKKKKKKKKKGESGAAAAKDGESGEAVEGKEATAAAEAEDGDDAEDGDGSAEAGAEAGAESAAKKKKKKKKSGGGGGGGSGPSVVSPSLGVKGFCDSYTRYGQTLEPSIPVAQLFGAGTKFPEGFPKGEEQPHPGEQNAFRTTSEEKRALERMNEDLYSTLRQASEVKSGGGGYFRAHGFPEGVGGGLG